MSDRESISFSAAAAVRAGLRKARTVPRHVAIPLRLRIPAPSWYAPQVIDVLRTTSPFASRITLDRNCQARLCPRARTGRPVQGQVCRANLARVGDHIRKWQRQGRTVFAFFDNDQKSAAPADAQRLMALIGIERDECAEHVRRSLPRRRDWQRTTVSSRP